MKLSPVKGKKKKNEWEGIALEVTAVDWVSSQGWGGDILNEIFCKNYARLL